MMDDMQLKALILGTVMVAVEAKRPGRLTMTELRQMAHDFGDKYVAEPARVDHVFDESLKMGMFVVAADEVSLSERGQTMIEINEKKIAVADLTGDMNIDLDEDDVKRVRGASPDLPG